MTPTRGRVPQLTRMTESARATADKPDELEFIFFVDEDDLESAIAAKRLGAKWVVGPRNIIHSARWDKCLPEATGELLFSANDDIVFKTPGWDSMLVEEFSKYPDKILMCHGDDLSGNGENFGCHPCIHKRWVEILGYFMTPYFDGDGCDTWVNDLANRIGRRIFVPYVNEHMHFIFQKAEVDTTMRERLDRQALQDPMKIYYEKEPERISEAEKLRALLGTPYEVRDSDSDAAFAPPVP